MHLIEMLKMVLPFESLSLLLELPGMIEVFWHRAMYLWFEASCQDRSAIPTYYLDDKAYDWYGI